MKTKAAFISNQSNFSAAPSTSSRACGQSSLMFDALHLLFQMLTNFILEFAFVGGVQWNNKPCDRGLEGRLAHGPPSPPPSEEILTPLAHTHILTSITLSWEWYLGSVVEPGLHFTLSGFGPSFVLNMSTRSIEKDRDPHTPDGTQGRRDCPICANLTQACSQLTWQIDELMGVLHPPLIQAPLIRPCSIFQNAILEGRGSRPCVNGRLQSPFPHIPISISALHQAMQIT